MNIYHMPYFRLTHHYISHVDIHEIVSTKILTKMQTTPIKRKIKIYKYRIVQNIKRSTTVTNLLLRYP